MVHVIEIGLVAASMVTTGGPTALVLVEAAIAVCMVVSSVTRIATPPTAFSITKILESTINKLMSLTLLVMEANQSEF